MRARKQTQRIDHTGPGCGELPSGPRGGDQADDRGLVGELCENGRRQDNQRDQDFNGGETGSTTWGAMHGHTLGAGEAALSSFCCGQGGLIADYEIGGRLLEVTPGAVVPQRAKGR